MAPANKAAQIAAAIGNILQGVTSLIDQIARLRKEQALVNKRLLDEFEAARTDRAALRSLIAQQLAEADAKRAAMHADVQKVVAAVEEPATIATNGTVSADDLRHENI